MWSVLFIVYWEHITNIYSIQSGSLIKFWKKSLCYTQKSLFEGILVEFLGGILNLFHTSNIEISTKEVTIIKTGLFTPWALIFMWLGTGVQNPAQFLRTFIHKSLLIKGGSKMCPYSFSGFDLFFPPYKGYNLKIPALRTLPWLTPKLIPR